MTNYSSMRVFDSDKEFGTDFDVPAVCRSQFMAIAFGMVWKNDAALDQCLIEVVELIRKAAGTVT